MQAGTPNTTTHTHPTWAPQDSPELRLLELVYAIDLFVYLIQLSGKGRRLRLGQRNSPG